MNPGEIPFNIDQTIKMCCKKCNNDTFTQAVFIRKVPKLLVGSMMDQLWPIPVFNCTKCGETLVESVPMELRTDSYEEVKETPSKNIILG